MSSKPDRKASPTVWLATALRPSTASNTGVFNQRRRAGRDDVLDAYSGKLVQKLPVLENICPSKSWAPNWKGGRCDAPGQLVGAATNPRVEGGLFLVDTNTGSSAFELEGLGP